MLFSHLFHHQIRSQKLNIPADRELWPKDWQTIHYKQYKRFPEILLPEPSLPSMTLQESLELRHSERQLRAGAMSIADLATILYFSFGLKATTEGAKGQPPKLRHYPSAGARYPIEVYVFIQNVETLIAGVYHYDVRNHSLRLLANQTTQQLLQPLLHSPNPRANATLLLTTKQSRNAIKYQDHGYDMLAIECGHASQNVLLVSTALKRQACPFFGYENETLAQKLDLDDDELIFYALLIN